MNIVLTATILPLGIIIYQDFKFRAISWYLIPVIFLLLFYTSFTLYDTAEVLKNTLINSIFIGVNLCIVFLYFSLKNKRVINLFRSYLGIGDVLFFISITPLFHPINFVLFFVVSLLITLIGSLIIFSIQKGVVKTIPLAAWMSVHVIILLIVEMVKDSDGLLMFNPIIA